MWGQHAAQLLGMQAQQASQTQDYYQRAYGAGISTSYSPIPITGGSCNTLYIDDTEAEEASLKVEEPPDEFTQLSNHKFHELLDRFKETT